MRLSQLFKNLNLKKKKLKTVSNEKLLRAAYQKIDFFLDEREN